MKYLSKIYNTLFYIFFCLILQLKSMQYIKNKLYNTKNTVNEFINDGIKQTTSALKKKVKKHAAAAFTDDKSKVEIKKTGDQNLDNILENYQNEYFQINLSKNEDGLILENNTLEIIQKIEENTINSYYKINSYHELLKKYSPHFSKNIIKIIYDKLIQLREKGIYYKKLLYYTTNEENKNDIFELSTEQKKEIIEIFSLLSIINQPAIVNLFLNNDIESLNKHLGNREISLLEKKKIYTAHCSAIKQNIENAFSKIEALHAKEILNNCISRFKESEENLLKAQEENKKFLEEKKSIPEIGINFRDEISKTQKEIGALKTEISKYNFLTKLIYPIKFKQNQTKLNQLNNQIKNATTKLELSHNPERLKDENKKNINKYNELDKKINDIKESRPTLRNITNLITELESLITQIKNMNFFTSETKSIINNIKNIIEIDFHKYNKMMLKSKSKEINEILSICDILETLNPIDSLIDNKENKLYNHIIYIIFFDQKTKDEKKYIILNLLNKIQINKKITIKIKDDNLFYNFLNIIYSGFNSKMLLLKDINDNLLNKLNSYFTFFILLQIINPKIQIENTYIYKIYSLFFKNIKNTNIKRKINAHKNFYAYLFHKSQNILEKIKSMFQKNNPSIINNIENDKKSTHTSSTKSSIEYKTATNNNDYHTESEKSLNLDSYQPNKMINVSQSKGL